jgi:predicted adenylyl cyclase CyaB
MALEREIKLRFACADDARARILALGATPLRGRRLQEDCLLDTDDEQLRRQRSVLRIRNEGGKSLLTFKGPVQPGWIKIREEHETVVADGDVLMSILEALGLHIWSGSATKNTGRSTRPRTS